MDAKERKTAIEAAYQKVQAGEKKEALKLVEELALSSPEGLEPMEQYRCGIVFEANGREDEAICFFRASEETGKTDPRFRCAALSRMTVYYTGRDRNFANCCYAKGVVLCKQNGFPIREPNEVRRGFLKPKDTEDTAKEAIRRLQRLRNRSYGPALLFLGECYENDYTGFELNPLTALAYYEKAAKAKLCPQPTAAFFAGKLYFEGTGGIARNPDRAKELFEQALDSPYSKEARQYLERIEEAERSAEAVGERLEKLQESVDHISDGIRQVKASQSLSVGEFVELGELLRRNLSDTGSRFAQLEEKLGALSEEQRTLLQETRESLSADIRAAEAGIEQKLDDACAGLAKEIGELFSENYDRDVESGVISPDIIERCREELQQCMGANYNKLSEYSKKSLLSALVFTKQTKGIIDPERLDYSGAVIAATSALEEELQNRLYWPLIVFLRLNDINCEAMPGGLTRTINGNKVLKSYFSLGDISYTYNTAYDLGYRNPLFLKSFLEVLQDFLENYCINHDYRGELPEQVFDLFEWKDDEKEKTYYEPNITGLCGYVTNAYRNKAAHAESLRWDELQSCLAYLIGYGNKTEEKTGLLNLILALFKEGNSDWCKIGRLLAGKEHEDQEKGEKQFNELKKGLEKERLPNLRFEDYYKDIFLQEHTEEPDRWNEFAGMLNQTKYGVGLTVKQFLYISESTIKKFGSIKTQVKTIRADINKKMH